MKKKWNNENDSSSDLCKDCVKEKQGVSNE